VTDRQQTPHTQTPDTQTPHTQTPGTDEATLRLLAEDLVVDRTVVETGRVRVRTVTRSRQEAVEVPLVRENFEVTRVPVGRVVEEIPPVRQDGDLTVMPVVEEIVVTERRLVLREEVHIRRVRTTEQHRETATLRYQDVEVTRLPADAETSTPTGNSVATTKE
jgi:uncharacterized protein (TIGR02271 family)